MEKTYNLGQILEPAEIKKKTYNLGQILEPAEICKKSYARTPLFDKDLRVRIWSKVKKRVFAKLLLEISNVFWKKISKSQKKNFFIHSEMAEIA